MAGALTFKQSISALVYKTPETDGAPITDKDFEILPYKSLELSGYSEDAIGRYNIDGSAVNQTLNMGTVETGECLIIEPDQDINIKVVNTSGTSQNILFQGGTSSIVHMRFTGLTASNPGATAITGRYAVVGTD